MKTTVQTLASSRQQLYINGRFVEPVAGRYSPSYDPTTGQPWTDWAEGLGTSGAATVAAAEGAFVDPVWGRMTQTDRGRLLRCLADLILQHTDALAEIETRDNGKLLKEMRGQMRA